MVTPTQRRPPPDAYLDIILSECTAGPRGAVVSFHQDKFAKPEGMIDELAGLAEGA
jgi:hypothetical protein